MIETSTAASELTTTEHSPKPNTLRRRLRSRYVSFLMALLAACVSARCHDQCLAPGSSDERSLHPCTPSMEFGLWVRALDANTGLAADCGITAWITDGAYIDTLQGVRCSLSESLHAGVMVGALERAGACDVPIAKPGYHLWSRRHVVVVREQCDCHGRTREIEARLQPL